MTKEQGHILVVDDHKTNRLKLSLSLKKQGHTVEVAENGQKALMMLREQSFDLMVLDIMMPGMDGYEVLAHMKKEPSLRDIPVIIISALSDMQSIVKGIEMGAEDYLPKTFDPILLKARIEASLEKKRLRDQQAAYLKQVDIENRRKSAELEHARQIQHSMLPDRPPVLPHLDIAARQKTASEVGGDYYDFLSQSSGKHLVIIGDATGHGVGSALMVSMIKALILAHAHQELTQLLKKINTILVQIGLGQKLNMGLLLLELSPWKEGSVSLRAIGGGLPPLYLLRPEATPCEIMVSGFPLGVTGTMTHELIELTLQSGEALLLMSDGFVERFNKAGEFLGYTRLLEALQKIDPSPLNAQEILEQVTEVGDQWAAGHPLHDDVTLVVIKAK